MRRLRGLLASTAIAAFVAIPSSYAQLTTVENSRDLPDITPLTPSGYLSESPYAKRRAHQKQSAPRATQMRASTPVPQAQAFPALSVQSTDISSQPLAPAEMHAPAPALAMPEPVPVAIPSSHARSAPLPLYPSRMMTVPPVTETTAEPVPVPVRQAAPEFIKSSEPAVVAQPVAVEPPPVAIPVQPMPNQLPPPPSLGMSEDETHVGKDWADMVPEAEAIFGESETGVTPQESMPWETEAPATPAPPSEITNTAFEEELAPLPVPQNYEPTMPEANLEVALASEIPPILADEPKDSSLSDEAKTILDRLPSNLDRPIRQSGKAAIERENPETGIGAADEEVREHDGLGMSIAVKQKNYDAEYELGRAYDAIIAGETHVAIAIYEEILSNVPRNVDALFGLASTYHRIGLNEDALRYYDRLLKIAPDNRDAITNFLALVAETSPADAIPHLEALEQRNPNFSPIPAQIALARQAMGDGEGAKSAMLRAIRISPDNLAYRYNLAVIFDQNGRSSEAAMLYKQLINAAQKGQTIPASVEDIQKRLTFLDSTG